MRKELKNLLQRAEAWPVAAQEQLLARAIEIETRLRGVFISQEDEEWSVRREVIARAEEEFGEE